MAGIAGCGANSASSKVNAAKGNSGTGSATRTSTVGRTATPSSTDAGTENTSTSSTNQSSTTEPSTNAESTGNTTKGNETTGTSTAPGDLPDLNLKRPDMVLHEAPLPSNPESKKYPTMGKDDAPLKVTFYGGWKCPYTRKFVTGFLNTLVKKFVLTGKVQLTFQFVAYENGRGFHGPDEPMVARTGYAVWHSDPTSFFRYMEYMYTNQHRESGWYTIDKLAAIAKAANASNTEWLMYANESQKYQQPVMDTMKDVHAIPIKHIPRLYISPAELGRDGTEAKGKDTVGEVLAPNLGQRRTIKHLTKGIKTVKSTGKK